MTGGITIDLSQVSELRETFREYAEWYSGELLELAVVKSRQLAGGVKASKYGAGFDGLYQTTAAIAPSEAKIESDVRSRGWRIPAYFSRGEGGGQRMGRGEPRMWGSAAWKAMRKGKRGRATKAEKALRQSMQAKPTLEQMQAFVIARRVRARRYLATGWLGAIADTGGVTAGLGEADRDRGGADIRESPGMYEVEFWNRTHGIEEANQKYGFAQKAVANCIADMQVYIERKKREAQDFIETRGALAA